MRDQDIERSRTDGNGRTKEETGAPGLVDSDDEEPVRPPPERRTVPRREKARLQQEHRRIAKLLRGIRRRTDEMRMQRVATHMR